MNHHAVDQRLLQPVGNQTPPHGGFGVIDYREQAAPAVAGTHVAVEFEVFPRGGVERHIAVGGVPFDLARKFDRALIDILYVPDRRRERGFGLGEIAAQGRIAEIFLEIARGIFGLVIVVEAGFPRKSAVA
ncbi:hypothetical protein SDC9_137188 [bioreactor metagenome]|uniref:Uncharacterized protein n=1 Tax=bioreactor metagenome TaxID=1076179 RepID=A0A645DNG1_9ZZZZ